MTNVLVQLITVEVSTILQKVKPGETVLLATPDLELITRLTGRRTDRRLLLFFAWKAYYERDTDSTESTGHTALTQHWSNLPSTKNDQSMFIQFWLSFVIHTFRMHTLRFHISFTYFSISHWFCFGVQDSRIYSAGNRLTGYPRTMKSINRLSSKRNILV